MSMMFVDICLHHPLPRGEYSVRVSDENTRKNRKRPRANRCPGCGAKLEGTRCIRCEAEAWREKRRQGI